MNKTVLITGGASVASLAVGAAAGYFYAKNTLTKKIGAEFDERLDREIDATKRHYGLLLTNAKSGKPDSPFDIPVTRSAPKAVVEVARIEETVNTAVNQATDQIQKIMTDYRGASSKNPVVADVVKNNLFKDDKKKPPLPPRNEHGKFVKRTKEEEEQDAEGPELISSDEYLRDEYNLEMGSLRWYSKDKTLLDYADEEVDLALVGGPEMLTNFPTDYVDGAERSICVRNMGYGWQWDITLMDDDEGALAGFEHNQLDQTDDEDADELDDEYSLDED